MPSCMVYTIRLCSETFSALKGAREGLDSAVNFLMDFEVRSLSERLPTARMTTHKLLHAIVLLYMIVEPMFAREHLVAAIEGANILGALVHLIYVAFNVIYGTR